MGEPGSGWSSSPRVDERLPCGCFVQPACDDCGWRGPRHDREVNVLRGLTAEWLCIWCYFKRLDGAEGT